MNWKPEFFVWVFKELRSVCLGGGLALLWVFMQMLNFLVFLYQFQHFQKTILKLHF